MAEVSNNVNVKQPLWSQMSNNLYGCRRRRRRRRRCRGRHRCRRHCRGRHRCRWKEQLYPFKLSR